MRVLIVHYHLKPGGVTTVIRRQTSALEVLGFDVRVLVGEAPEGSAAESGFPLILEPALAYDQEGQNLIPDDPRIDSIVAAVQSNLGPPAGDAVVHVHNPTIRKNSACLPALSILASKGYALVLHVHDLAEDWRPDVYCPGSYPQPAVWAGINRRDVRNLMAAGAQQVCFLPNAAFAGRPGDFSGQSAGPDGSLILYPVRGIRRKNLGEALLLSLYLPAGLSVGVTLPPNSPKDVPYYKGWKAAAGAFNAPMNFGLGLSSDFDELYRQSRAVVSTSIKEGFGLAFLEPLSRGKAVLGRRIPAVVDDFEESGLRFPGLYPRITVPEGFFDLDTFLNRLKQVVNAAADVYGLEGGNLAGPIARSLAVNTDFGRLDETAQAETISRIAADTGARSDFLAANSFLEVWWEPQGGPVAPEALAPWSEASYGTRLVELYQVVRETGGGAPPDKAALLALYLNPEGFHGVGI